MTSFGDFIKNLRIKNNLTQTQFAAKIDIDAAALSKIENGKKRLPSAKIEKLCKLFNLNLLEITNEYFSEKIAYELYENNCTSQTLVLAEEKLQYLKHMD